MSEKLASAEIAESRARFRELANAWRAEKNHTTGYHTWEGITKMLAEFGEKVERDTRERCALEIKEMTRRWRGKPLIAADWIVERIREGKG